ncbi:MAG: 23S rRNA (adenine(2503)-C(2))-methyltransferase RlmN [Syntrophorhabdaceae bacterium]|nr:23S rRNA (adenine(2503)-C(2))-methyltransferase RlmN [Syntrophorhabdaceae bacterium]
MINFFGLTLKELEDTIGGIGKERFRARQLFRWIYKKDICDFSKMEDIPKSLRTLFKDMFNMQPLIPKEVFYSKDGSVKFSFETRDKHIIESVLIPEKNRMTLCVSSQIGCRMACAFCMTGKMGFIRNLGTDEIIGQVMASREFLKKHDGFLITDDKRKRDAPEKEDENQHKKITNIVFMGMGEPMDNFENVIRALDILKDQHGLDFSKRRITISSVGLLAGLNLLKPNTAGIAISLNAPDDKKRTKIMPINRLYSIKDIIEFVKQYKVSPRERITFEYVMLKDFNDSLDDARALYELLKGVKCKINLIPFNESPFSEFKTPDKKTVDEFHRYLINRYMTVIVRESRGSDIHGACGQLGMSYLKNCIEKSHREGIK